MLRAKKTRSPADLPLPGNSLTSLLTNGTVEKQQIKITAEVAELQKNCFLRSWSYVNVKKLYMKGEKVDFLLNQSVFGQDAPIKNVYFIYQGEAKVTAAAPQKPRSRKPNGSAISPRLDCPAASTAPFP